MAQSPAALEAKSSLISEALSRAQERLGGESQARMSPEEALDLAADGDVDPEPEQSESDSVDDLYGEREDVEPAAPEGDEPAAVEPDAEAPPVVTAPAEPEMTPFEKLRWQEYQAQQAKAEKAQAEQAERARAQAEAQWNDPEWRFQQMKKAKMVDDDSSEKEIALASFAYDGHMRNIALESKIQALEAKQEQFFAQLAQGAATHTAATRLETKLADYEVSAKAKTALTERIAAHVAAGYDPDQAEAYELDLFLDGRSKKTPAKQAAAKPKVGPPPRTPAQIQTLRNAAAGNRGAAPERKQTTTPSEQARANVENAFSKLRAINTRN